MFEHVDRGRKVKFTGSWSVSSVFRGVVLRSRSLKNVFRKGESASKAILIARIEWSFNAKTILKTIQNM